MSLILGDVSVSNISMTGKPQEELMLPPKHLHLNVLWSDPVPCKW